MGYFDILFTEVVSKEIQISSYNGKVKSLIFGEFLFDSDSRGRSKNQTLSGFIDSLNQFYPLLQICIPELPDNDPKDWDIENHLPKVAFRPDNKSDLVLAYDQDGNVEVMSTLVVPNELVITISENERLIEFKKEQNYSNGRMLLEDCSQLNEIDPYFSNNEYEYYLATDLNKCYPARILRPSEPTQTTQNLCDRDKKNTKDEINKMRFENMGYYRETRDDAFGEERSGWFDSRLEMRVTVTFGAKSGAITQLNKYFGGKETNFKNCSILQSCLVFYG